MSVKGLLNQLIWNSPELNQILNVLDKDQSVAFMLYFGVEVNQVDPKLKQQIVTFLDTALKSRKIKPSRTLQYLIFAGTIFVQLIFTKNENLRKSCKIAIRGIFYSYIKLLTINSRVALESFINKVFYPIFRTKMFKDLKNEFSIYKDLIDFSLHLFKLVIIQGQHSISQEIISSILLEIKNQKSVIDDKELIASMDTALGSIHKAMKRQEKAQKQSRKIGVKDKRKAFK